jgi:hypothetical protein
VKIEIKKGRGTVVFTPEKSIDHYYCGLIHCRVPSSTIITSDSVNLEPKLSSLEISQDILILELTRNRGK